MSVAQLVQPLSLSVEKIYGRSPEREINRFKTWTFDHF